LLGRALDCHARRDADSARHFAYYAELRAAISLLASQGIAVFDNKHFVFGSSSFFHEFPGRTHTITWQVLEHWSELTRSAKLLGKCLRVQGVPISEWLEHFSPRGSFRALGQDWLKTWGLDLRDLHEDQYLRNEASYRPNAVNVRAFPSVEEAAQRLCALWSVCEPVSRDPFASLDRYLLRIALEYVFKSGRGVEPAEDPELFKLDVRSMVSQVFDDENLRAQWVEFLTRTSDPDDPILLSAARRRSLAQDPLQHMEMISRAALLLRVATAANADLLRQAGIIRDDLAFWLTKWGQERGLWREDEDPANFSDLWADAEDAVRTTQLWITETPVGERNFLNWRTQQSSGISILGSCERIALWGLSL